MLNPGDVKLTHQRQTYAKDANNQTIPVMEIGYTVRGQGNHTVNVPLVGFTADRAMALILEKAKEIADLMDRFS